MKIGYVTVVYMDYIEGKTVSAVHCYLEVVPDLFFVPDIFVFLAAQPRMGNGYSNDDNLLLCLKKGIQSDFMRSDIVIGCRQHRVVYTFYTTIPHA